MDYFDEAREIWSSFVPKAGQSSTVQGELLRAVEKLRDEAQRNGNLNWSKDFKLLVDYLEVKLTDESVYSFEKIDTTKHMLRRLRNSRNPYTNDDYFDFLGDRVVEYFRFYGSQPHQENPALNI